VTVIYENTTTIMFNYYIIVARY